MDTLGAVLGPLCATALLGSLGARGVLRWTLLPGLTAALAFATLARRLPGLQLAVPPDELRFKQADIYGMKELPVTW